MSNCIIPNWNLRYQRQEEAQEVEQAHEGNNRSSHVQSLMSNYGIAELTWENGQPAMHGHGDSGICQDKPRTTINHSYIRSQDLNNISRPTWNNTNDSLESIVHQATYNNKNIDFIQQEKNEAVGTSSMVPITGKWEERVPGEDTRMPPNPVAGMLKKRVRSESDQSGRYFSCGNINQEEQTERSSTCASASARFCRDNSNDMTTMMTWPSESWRSVKTKTIDEDHDSASHGGSDNKNGENNDNKRETSRSHMTRSSQAAAVHNQSERRRRDRINQKMKALQKMVPNASKTDKASMLDEVIAYLKHLQAQIHMISNTRNMPPQMMIPPAMLQQQLQMSVLARMGMAGMAGMGMLDMNNMARNAPVNHASMAGATFAPAPPFPMPQAIPTRPQSQENTAPTANSPVPYNPYYAFLAQSMNMDLYSKMAALFQQQPNQSSSTSSQANHVKRE